MIIWDPGNENSASNLVQRAALEKKKKLMKTFCIRTAMKNLTVNSSFRKGSGWIRFQALQWGCCHYWVVVSQPLAEGVGGTTAS